MSMNIFLIWVLMISCTVAANLCLKLGATDGLHTSLVGLVMRPAVLLGLALFGLSGILYTWVLRVLPLNVAQSFAAAQFVSVILASSLLLSESIPPLRWLGICFIAVGVAIVSASMSAGASSQ